MFKFLFNRLRPELSAEDIETLRSLRNSKLTLKDGMLRQDPEVIEEALRKLHESTKHLFSNDYCEIRIHRETLAQFDQYAQKHNLRRGDVFQRAVALLSLEEQAQSMSQQIKQTKYI